MNEGPNLANILAVILWTLIPYLVWVLWYDDQNSK